MNRPSERGSAILMLFIAVALFGMLSYAFLQGSRTSTTVVSDEQAKVYAQQVIAYSNDIAMGVKRLSMRGCLDTKISTQNKSGNYPNPNAPSDHSCDVFHVAGAGISEQVIPLAWYASAPSTYNPWFNGEMAVQDIGTTAPELVMWINDLKPEICTAINRMVGINAVTSESVAPVLSYQGVYTLVDTLGDVASSPFKGKRNACWANNYFHVLLPR